MKSAFLVLGLVALLFANSADAGGRHHHRPPPNNPAPAPAPQLSGHSEFETLGKIALWGAVVDGAVCLVTGKSWLWCRPKSAPSFKHIKSGDR